MKPVVIHATVLAATLLLVSSIANAKDQNPATSGDPVLDTIHQIDRNGNGCVDAEEGRNYSARRFHALDKNGDEQLDASEAPLVPGEDAGSRPISLAAWADAYPHRFAAIDTDGNGCLTEQEIRANMPEAQNGGQ